MEKKLFRHLEPGDMIWQVLETSHNIWEIVPRPVTDVEWPYRKITGDYHYLKMSDGTPIGVDHNTTYEDDPGRVAINGPFGFVLSADTDQERDLYVNKDDAEKARLRHLMDALDRIDKEREEEVLDEIEKYN